MNLAESISIVLIKNRKRLKLSQEELAAKCDLDRTYISLLERSKRKPTINVIFSISYALEIKPSKFIRQVEEQLK